MTDPDRAHQLREQVVDELVQDGTITSAETEQAMRIVPRHLFIPEVDVEEAYSTYNAVVTKRDEHGMAVSSVSAPQIQAMMLEQASIAPGMRVLEIGSGGYNAALIAELTGAGGEVTTVDIDPDVTARARRLLEHNGYPQVRVLTADAEGGAAQYAPYDRILVTVGAWDIPPAWVAQLTEKGRLVVPLRMRSLTRSLGLERVGDHLIADSALVCGFVAMQGKGAYEEQLLLMRGTGEIGLRFDDGLPADPSLLDNVLRSPRVETWTGASVGLQEPIGSLQMYLASHLPGFCIMAVDPDLDTGLAAPTNKGFSMAAVDGGTFAYLVTRRSPDDRCVEYGVHAMGPHGAEFAEEVAQHVRTWAQEQRNGPGPRIEVFPADTPDAYLPSSLVIDKKHIRVALTWPPAVRTADRPVA